MSAAARSGASKTDRIDTTALVLALWLLLFGVLHVARLTQSSVGHDFFQFWSVGRGLAAGDLEGLYSEATARAAARRAMQAVSGPDGSARGQRAAQLNRQLYPSGVDPISTPLYYTAFAALTGADYDRALLAYQTLSTLAFLAAAWALCRAIGFGRVPALLALATLLIAYGPLHADIQTGNANRLQLALLAAAFALPVRWRGPLGAAAGGAALACVVALKPNLAAVPLFLAVVWALDRRFAALRWWTVGLLLGALVAVASAALYVGSVSSWLDWVAALSRYQSNPAPIERTNWSTARLLYAWTGRDWSVPLLAALVASFAACAWRGRRFAGADARARRAAMAASAGCLVPLIASLLAWDHYFLLATPALLFALRPGAGSVARPCAGALALFVCARAPLELAFGIDTQAHFAAFMAAATALLWVTLAWDLAARAPEPRDEAC